MFSQDTTQYSSSYLVNVSRKKKYQVRDDKLALLWVLHQDHERTGIEIWINRLMHSPKEHSLVTILYKETMFTVLRVLNLSCYIHIYTLIFTLVHEILNTLSLILSSLPGSLNTLPVTSSSQFPARLFPLKQLDVSFVSIILSKLSA